VAGDRYRAARKAAGAEQLLQAIEYARDRADHQGSEVLLATPGTLLAFGLGVSALGGPELIWLPFAELSPAGKRHEKPDEAAAYKSELAGKPVRNGVDAALSFFASVRYAG